MKKFYFKAVNWSKEFQRVNGSYYDYAVDFEAFSESIMVQTIIQLISQGWTKVQTKNGLRIFEKDRFIVRVHKCFPVDILEKKEGKKQCRK